MHFDRCAKAFAGLTCVLILASGCSSDSAPGTEPTQNEKYLGLETPENGFQVRSFGTTIEAGTDVEFCEVAELPGDPSETYYVGAIELGNGDFSHHLIVSAAIPGSEADARLRAMNIGDRVPCLSAETAFGQEGITGVYGVQQPYGRIDFPSGVGREYRGGQRIVFDYHYYNTSTDAVAAKSAINFHLTKASEIRHLARGFSFSNWLIETPPGALGNFTGECRFSDDVMLGGLTRHTHRWGTDYSVWFAGGARDGEHLWTSEDFQHDVDYRFDEPLLMKAGEGFRFECNFDNTESYPLRFGTQATDEMCILFGLIWSAGEGRDVPDQDCDITWEDAEGIGRPVGPEGFPKPSETEVSLCVAGSSSEDEGPNECMECRCGACASVLIRCATDPDCSAILECVQSTSEISECESTISAHSSAVGLLRQVGACMESSSCTACDSE